MSMPHPNTEPPAEGIAQATQVGVVALTVADLERSLAFYTGALGFALLTRNTGGATLGAGEAPLLLLTEEPEARPWPSRGYAGLYHFAILVPSQADLGRWLRHWLEAGYPLPGQGDHLVSEALYLSDPDGNGIEVYRDRPRAEWAWSGGQVRMASDPVDMRGLLEAAAASEAPWAGLAGGTRLGHMHLQVGDIAAADGFYHGVLGFEVTAKMPGALFVSAGGYHHHIGLNTWQSRGAGPAPASTAGLRFFSLELPDAEARAAVVARLKGAGLAVAEAGGIVSTQDPWSNTLVLGNGAASSAQATGFETVYAVAHAARAHAG